MRKFVRLITRNKWPKTAEELDEYMKDIDNKITAKTIVQEMQIKGTDSALSIWELDNDKDLVLSLINNKKECLSKMDFLTIDEELLQEYGLNIKHIEGNSIAPKLNDKHYDISDMKYKSLGDFAKVIMTALKNEDINFKRVDRKDVENYVREAVEKGEIDINDLSEKLRIDLFGEEEIGA